MVEWFSRKRLAIADALTGAGSLQRDLQDLSEILTGSPEMGVAELVKQVRDLRETIHKLYHEGIRL